jgi:hypothetical protein
MAIAAKAAEPAVPHSALALGAAAENDFGRVTFTLAAAFLQLLAVLLNSTPSKSPQGSSATAVPWHCGKPVEFRLHDNKRTAVPALTWSDALIVAIVDIAVVVIPPHGTCSQAAAVAAVVCPAAA